MTYHKVVLSSAVVWSYIQNVPNEGALSILEVAVRFHLLSTRLFQYTFSTMPFQRHPSARDRFFFLQSRLLSARPQPRR